MFNVKIHIYFSLLFITPFINLSLSFVYINQIQINMHTLLKLLINFSIVLQCFALSPSSNIQNPKKVSSNGRGVTINGDATVSTIIPVPSQFATVVDIQIQSGGQYCNTTKVEPSVLRQSLFSIQQTNSQMFTNKWNVEIMSSIFVQGQHSMYVLLDNGTLLVDTPSNQNEHYKAYTFNGVGETETWLTEKHTLVYFRDLYVIKNEEMRKVILHKQGYWKTELNYTKNQVVKAFVLSNRMYVVTFQTIYYMLQYGWFEQLNIKGKKIIDFLIIDHYFYLLDEQLGLIYGQIFEQSRVVINTFNNYTIESVSHIKKMRGNNRVLFFIYEIQERNYIAEYLMQKNSLVLNRYYHNYYSVRDIIISQNYAVIDAYNQFIVLHHSINRNSFNSLQPVQFLYRSRGIKIIEIGLYHENLSLLVTFKDSIQFIGFTSKNMLNNQSYGINNLFVTCKSEKPITFLTSIKYRGICSDIVHNPQNFYCQAIYSDTLSFQYSHKKKIEQHKFNQLLFGLGFIALICFSILILLGIQKRLSKIYNDLKKKEEERKNKKEQHSINMEKTFNAQT